MRRQRHPAAQVITEAPPNPRDEYDYRRKRYLATMSVRILCLILAAVFYKFIWVWPFFAAGALVLPWVAVVLANDRLPRNGTRFQRYSGLDDTRAIAPPRPPQDDDAARRD
jgi:Protein of unknown function (DUF3099)